ncbi:hypothetical protein [Rhodocyclus tenuis]|uniref:Uncharacterized protein n=1 Tax=Rhodocyclus tenuis TaxID=1066 RepID=A0A840GLJ5_RHOTE|nr:hypothetical protein [Rhodocyclus tenuis]MBB4249029.1 hypothetical protein [Rhodocyclus tenuis]
MQFFDLAAEELDDGRIRLTQRDADDEYSIDLHPEQIRFLARRLFGRAAEEAAAVADVERRIGLLQARFESILANPDFRGDLLTRCANGPLWLARLDAIDDLARAFAGRLEAQCLGGDETPSAGSQGGAAQSGSGGWDIVLPALTPATTAQPALAL